MKKTYKVSLKEFKDFDSFKNKSTEGFREHPMNFTELDLRRHMYVCNPLGLKNPKGNIDIYDELIDNLIEIKNNNNSNYISIRDNILNAESTFKTNISFMLGMLFTSLIAEKKYGACPFNIRHLLQLGPKAVKVVKKSKSVKVSKKNKVTGYLDSSKDIHPDFFAISSDGKKAYLFDAKGSISVENGYINNKSADKGVNQLKNIYSVRYGSKLGFSEFEKFVGSIARNKKNNELCLSTIDPEETGEYILDIDLSAVLEDHYKIYDKGEEINIGNARYLRNDLGNGYTILSPKDYEEYFWKESFDSRRKLRNLKKKKFVLKRSDEKKYNEGELKKGGKDIIKKNEISYVAARTENGIEYNKQIIVPEYEAFPTEYVTKELQEGITLDDYSLSDDGIILLRSADIDKLLGTM